MSGRARPIRAEHVHASVNGSPGECRALQRVGPANPLPARPVPLR